MGEGAHEGRGPSPSSRAAAPPSALLVCPLLVCPYRADLVWEKAAEETPALAMANESRRKESRLRTTII